MKINELSFNPTGARYGYNGTHEQELAINPDGNHLDFGNFGYDTRVAMRRNQEPLRAKYPNFSNYNIFANNPILFKDTDGNDPSVTDYLKLYYNKSQNLVSNGNFKTDGEISKKSENKQFIKVASSTNNYNPLSSALDEISVNSSTIDQYEPGLFTNIENSLKINENDNYLTIGAKASINTLYNLGNGPYSGVTGSTLGGESLKPGERIAELGSAGFSALTSQTKLLGLVPKFKGSGSSWNNFQTVKKGTFSGKSSAKDAASAYKTNQNGIKALDISKNVKKWFDNIVNFVKSSLDYDSKSSEKNQDKK